MKKNKSESHFEDTMKALSFSCERLKTYNSKCADYRIGDGENNYLVEIKHKEATPIFLSASIQTSEHAIGSATMKTDKVNAISSRFQKAAKQLKLSPGRTNEFLIAWFYIPTNDFAVLQDQMLRVLYGMIDVGVAEGPDFPIKILGKGRALYIGRSEFHFNPEIEACVIDNGVGGKLLINEFSIKYKDFKTSKLCNIFAESTRFDPPFKVDSQCFFAGDPAIATKDKIDALRHLREKYSPLLFIEAHGEVTSYILEISPEVLNHIAKKDKSSKS